MDSITASTMASTPPREGQRETNNPTPLSLRRSPAHTAQRPGAAKTDIGARRRSVPRWLVAVATVLILCVGVTVAFGASGWFGVDPGSDSVYGQPFRYVGRVVTFWDDRVPQMATGFLVGRSHVVTAAHALYKGGKQPLAVMFTPGEYYGKAPFGSANATKWGVAQPYIEGNSFYDYAIIKLNKPLGDRTLGWFQFSDWEEGTRDARVCGYAAELNYAQSIYRTDVVQASPLDRSWDPRDDGVRWTAPGFPLRGLSGAPLFFRSGTQFRVIGLNSHSDPTGGLQGVRFSRAARTGIQTWILRNP